MSGLHGNSRDHLTFFLNKIKANEPFGIIRPGDGEYAVMRNQQISTGDNWTFRSGGKLAADLMSAICTDLPEFYVGISCPGCSADICNYMMGVLPCASRITYANIFCNRNWRYFIDFMKGREFFYIGPGTASTDEFKVAGRMLVDPLLVEKWDTERDAFLAAVDAFVAPHKGKVFCISAGPVAKVLVPRLMASYPQNIYLDCGSALDIYLKGATNRSYINDNQFYTHIVCNFEEPHHVREPYVATAEPATKPAAEFAAEPAADPAAEPAVEPAVEPAAQITAILNLYKRPHTLIEQVAAIRAQTIKPSKIILWVNQADGVVIPPEIARDRSIHIIFSSQNTGVWGRFTAGILAQTEYVCVFDDDTIPGRRWFENCVKTMSVTPGLLGTVGLIFAPGNSYRCGAPRIGWPGPNKETRQVDIVGHSWFFKRSWLSALFSEMPQWPDMFTAGEDIAFSAGLQKIGVPTLVPPHPPGEEELYGSIPKSAWAYGMEPVGISMNSEGYSKFDVCLKHFIDRGFVTLMNRRLTGAEKQ
jgi:hypothetical protein